MLPNVQARIVDPVTMKDVPNIGDEGELWMKGPIIMKGYINRPDATKDTIVEDGWLRTGDIAKVDEEGWFYITDRIKELIKYKGFQVPPAELEAVLLSHDAVAGESDFFDTEVGNRNQVLALIELLQSPLIS